MRKIKIYSLYVEIINLMIISLIFYTKPIFTLLNTVSTIGIMIIVFSFLRVFIGVNGTRKWYYFIIGILDFYIGISMIISPFQFFFNIETIFSFWIIFRSSIGLYVEVMQNGALINKTILLLLLMIFCGIGIFILSIIDSNYYEIESLFIGSFFTFLAIEEKIMFKINN